LDVGCGPGRHSLEFARRGFTVEGIDISGEFIDLANASADAEGMTNATFTRMDARMLCDDHTRDAAFDLVICLCQGAFGLMRSPEDDQRVFAGLSSVLRPGGALVLSAFNAYFQIRHHIDATFDAATGVSHERTSVLNPDGIAREVDLWTGCYTPKELGALARHNGVAISQMYGVEPGGYGRSAPSVDLPEILLVGHRQPGAGSV
jgi:2-polyprenyl-3-methyl-5-hydroxy-6-metoxy-1,4-benzoquinol methylase